MADSAAAEDSNAEEDEEEEVKVAKDGNAEESTKTGTDRRANVNYMSDVLDEIALEGLDGITLEATAKRIDKKWNGSKKKKKSDAVAGDGFRAFLWKIVRLQKEISVYQLDQDRDELKIFNRYEHLDCDLGVVMEPELVPKDLYPFVLVDDAEKGVRGSCETYGKRKNVTDAARKMDDVKELALTFGESRLVLVASQQMRNEALMGPFADPLLAETLTAMQYCILERVGRSREHGEVTQGKMSLQFMKENPKTLFYHRKNLLKHGLIKKQGRISPNLSC
jgi:general transcription factor 3C polypeptide 1